ALKSSLRLIAKCSHIAFETSMPARSSSVVVIFLTSGTQDPHEVPARGQAFTWLRSVHPCAVTASRTVAALTLLHEHTVAASGNSRLGRSPKPSGSSQDAGSPGSSAPTMGRRLE